MIQKYHGELLLAPCPTVLVTSMYENTQNVLTVSWAGVASSHPEYITISIKPTRLSYSIISKTKKFCINIPSVDLMDAVDFCGNNSGRDVDKFVACGFSKKIISEYILIEQCKMYVLCDVERIVDLGSHHLFVAKVTAKYLNAANVDNINQCLNPIAYYRPFYYKLDDNSIGYYGYTNKK